MRDAIELLAHGGVDLRPTVTVDVDPQRRVAVEVATTALVDEPGAFAGGDHERVVALPLRLLGERVPEPDAIELGDRGANLRHRRRFCQTRASGTSSNPEGTGSVQALRGNAALARRALSRFLV